MRKFFLDLILVIIPILISVVGYVFFNLVDTSARVRSVKYLYENTILRIDKRLDRIENKIDSK